MHFERIVYIDASLHFVSFRSCSLFWLFFSLARPFINNYNNNATRNNKRNKTTPFIYGTKSIIYLGCAATTATPTTTTMTTTYSTQTKRLIIFLFKSLRALTIAFCAHKNRFVIYFTVPADPFAVRYIYM